MPTLKHACDASPYGLCRPVLSGIGRCVTRSSESYMKSAHSGRVFKQLPINSQFESLCSVRAPEHGHNPRIRIPMTNSHMDRVDCPCPRRPHILDYAAPSCSFTPSLCSQLFHGCSTGAA